MEYKNLSYFFNYNSKNGSITSKSTGENVGYKTKGKRKGYIQISFNKKTYLAHRIAWAIFYKIEPPKMIDHINGNGFDNRIENLRATNHRLNGLNRKSHRNGRLQGCSFLKKDKIWISYIRIDKKRIHLGTFKTEKEAHEAYVKKAKEIGEYIK